MTPRLITYNGETKRMKEWCDQFGLRQDTVSWRLDKLGWSVEKALTTPARKMGKTQDRAKSGRADTEQKGLNNMGFYDNRSNYTDPTAYLGLSGQNARPGEIWSSRRDDDDEFLVIKNHGEFCTTLKLNEESKFNCLQINSRAIKYTNPAMVGYTFCNTFGEFVKKVPDIEFAAVLKALEKALSLTVVEVFAETEKKVNSEELEAAQDKLAVWKQRYKELNAEYNLLRAENETLMSSAKTNVEIQAEALKAVGQLELMKSMYNDMLEKFIAKGVG